MFPGPTSAQEPHSILKTPFHDGTADVPWAGGSASVAGRLV